jgi:hypothetical protein
MRISQFHIQTIGPIPISTIPNVVEILPAVPKISTRIPPRTGAAIKNARVARTSIIPLTARNSGTATARLLCPRVQDLDFPKDNRGGNI